MRDLTNAIVRFSWAIPLFGMQQMLDVLTCQSNNGRGTGGIVDALNEVTDAALRNMSGSMVQIADSWEQAQNAVSNAVFRNPIVGNAKTKPAPSPDSSPYGQ